MRPHQRDGSSTWIWWVLGIGVAVLGGVVLLVGIGLAVYMSGRIDSDGAILTPVAADAGQPPLRAVPAIVEAPVTFTAAEEASAVAMAHPKPPSSARPRPSDRKAVREAAITAEVNKVDVVVYSAPWCSACTRAKDWMQTNDVAFRERNVDTDPEAARDLTRLNPHRSIPTFDIEGETQVGFSPGRVVAGMRSAATRRVDARQ